MIIGFHFESQIKYLSFHFLDQVHFCFVAKAVNVNDDLRD